ncbi:MAG: DUF2480 family protein [Candidatus Marinimicrobia bacterium]|nr:DUF2480 family protein [Candidatus Neomarinimicrobiota bacterium]
MITIYLDDFLEGGILRETSFRAFVDEIDWSQYQGKRVMIKGCADVPLPTWAYLIITARLAQHADYILYGEPCSAVKIFSRNKR